MFKVLKPSREDLKVFDPATKLHLPKEGKKVKLTSYWRRRLSCGDCLEVKEEEKKEEVKQVKKSEKSNKQSQGGK